MDEEREPIRSTPKKRPSMWLVLVLLVALAILAAGVLFFIKHHAGASPLKTAAAQVSFPVYYASKLPSYFFLDEGSISTKGDILIYTLVRNDNRKITITEQALPDGFSTDGINGLQHTLPGVGTVIIGEGFQGQRAVLTTAKTLILLTATKEISQGDLQSIAYGFQPLR